MVAFQENIIFSLQTADVSEISYEISIYNLREVSIEFQENNNGLRFLRRPFTFMGINFK